MPAGRKPRGIEQVELLPGSAAAKLRLEVLLANLAGELTVESPLMNVAFASRT